MSHVKDRHIPPPPGAGDPAKFKMDHLGQVVATLPDGTTVKSKSGWYDGQVEVHRVPFAFRNSGPA